MDLGNEITDGKNRTALIKRQDISDTLGALWQAQNQLGRLMREDAYTAGYQAGFEDALKIVARGLGVSNG